MIALLNSLLPIFLLILLGAGMKRTRFVADESWAGMERISYYVFFPALLMQTLYRADLGELAAGRSAVAFLVGIGIMLGVMIAVRPLLQRALGIGPASYSSLYQATTRWNAFIILAIAEKIASPEMLAVVAICIGVVIIPINVANIAVVAALADPEARRTRIARQVLTNPLILAVAFGLLLQLSGIALPELVETFIELLARVSLPMGLVLVGAGLRLRMPGPAVASVAAATAIKLLVMPAVFGASAWFFGVRGEELAVVALCGAGPSAMNGYIVARELGGDAPLFAAMVTAQTIVAFLTIPLVLLVAGGTVSPG